MKNLQLLTKLLIKLLLSAMLILSTQHAFAHGYVSKDEGGDFDSRARKCQSGLNTMCGGAQYEPQSTGETFQGFPGGSGGSAGQGPKDGQIASGGNNLFSALDAQTETRWHKTEITDPNITFSWKYLAPHPVDFHEYFITKDNWDHNKPLTRASFESTPFCKFPGSGVMPVPGTKHACVIPPTKRGYHVILGVWGVRDTKMAFHDPIDVNIKLEPGSPSGWNNVGGMRQSVSLLRGDTVEARAFNNNGEAFNYSTKITIASQAEGQQTEWPYVLAQKINNTQTLVAAGIRDANDVITPVRGPNDIYAKSASAVTHFEVEVKIQDDPNVRMAISAMPADTPLTAGKAKMRVPVLTTHAMDVQLTLFDANNKPVGSITTKIPSGSSWLELDITTNPGPHKLIMTGTTEDGRTSRQEEQSANVTGTGGAPAYDYKFPDQLKLYQAGTLVLGTDGNVYECKPFPYSGLLHSVDPHSNLI